MILPKIRAWVVHMQGKIPMDQTKDSPCGQRLQELLLHLGPLQNLQLQVQVQKPIQSFLHLYENVFKIMLANISFRCPNEYIGNRCEKLAPPTTSVTPPTTPPGGHDGLSAGAIAAIVFGVIFIIIIGVVSFFYFKSKRR